jgi:ubiquinone/menaquinone biosynthesis C-methylase UbiE
MPQEKEPIRLNLGCGLLTSPGWVNVDGSWNARLAKHPTLRRALAGVGILARDKSKIPWDSTIFIHDIRTPLPFPAGSATAVYASHVLEHMYFEEGRRLLRESFRVLSSGGLLRIVVPDLHAIVREYLGERPFGPLSPDMEALRPADRFNQRLLMRSPAPSSANLFYRLYENWEDFHSHKWMYDLDSLTDLFVQAGFVEVQSMECHVSRITDIQGVEDPSRILNGGGICVEGLRP